MKTLLTVAVLLPAISLYATDSLIGPSPLQFSESDYQEIQQKAKAEGKLFFLHFTADHVDNCEWMNEHTFTNKQLTNYLSRSYLAAEVDIEKPEGARLQYQFEINLLPTTLVFSSKAELIGAIEGKQTAKEMIAALRVYDTPEYRIMPAKVKGGIVRPAAYRAVRHKVSRPRLIPDASALANQNHYQPQMEAVQSVTPTTDQEQYPSIYKRPQKVQRPSRPTAFYAVQVGVFSNHQNAFREKVNLERYGTTGHLLPIKSADGRTKYRLCAGTFNEKSDAQLHQNKLSSRYPDSFIKWIQE
jgi:thioredoxin-related protein